MADHVFVCYAREDESLCGSGAMIGVRTYSSASASVLPLATSTTQAAASVAWASAVLCRTMGIGC